MFHQLLIAYLPTTQSRKMKVPLIIVALFASYVAAKSHMPHCADKCGKEAAKHTKCGKDTSKACVCKSTEFQNTVAACVAKKCNKKDQAAAEKYAKQLCA
ncbi:CFEM domain protein [Ceratobasidium sp. AG-Ba]|nr:CFEM domain protein [Ceratobasidium sp. AG-Ba]